jgi:kynurenine formamidase
MSETYVFLSHPLGPTTPTIPGNAEVRFTLLADHSRGDRFTQSTVETVNHNGTHVDAPRHFNANGLTITELEPDAWRFSSPVVLDLEAGDDELLTGERLRPHAQLLPAADAVLVRTGHGRFRRSNPRRYAERNPGFDRSFGEVLLEHGGRVRGLFADVPSFCAMQRVDPGLEFHELMLGSRRDDRFVLLFEDVDLSMQLNSIAYLWALPLLLDGLDGAPVTIVAALRGGIDAAA